MGEHQPFRAHRYSICLSLLASAACLAGASPMCADAQGVSLAEALDNHALTWSTGGAADWTGQTDDAIYGGDAGRSGAAPAGQHSWIETTLSGPGILAFYWKLTFGFTWLSFLVDGVEMMDCLSTAWQQRSFVIPTGTHTLRWVWAPTLSGYAGYLDHVTYAEAPALMVVSPNGGETWQHRDMRSTQWLATPDVESDVAIEWLAGETPVYTLRASAGQTSVSRFVPPALAPGSGYQVRITSAADPSRRDTSDAPFTIASASHSALKGLLAVDGADDQADAIDHPDLRLGQAASDSYTLEAWFYMRANSSSPVDKQHLAGKGAAYDLYAIRYYDYGAMRNTSCIGLAWTSPPSQPHDVMHCRAPAYGLGWHHVAAVYDASTGQARLYLDGAAYGNPFAASPSLAHDASPLSLGQGLSGAMDEVRLSSAIRYSGTSYATPTLPLACDAATRALWHLDEPEGAFVFLDACGAGHTLTGYNGGHAEGVPAHGARLPLVNRAS